MCECVIMDDMNDNSNFLNKLITYTVTIISILGVLAVLGGYLYYRNISIEDNSFPIADEADALSDSDAIIQTLESIPKADSQDALIDSEVNQILKDNQEASTEEETLTPEERSQILKNNTENQ